MTARNFVTKELNKALEGLNQSTGNGEYSSHCVGFLEKIRKLNDILNNKEKLDEISKISSLIEEKNNKINDMIAHIKNEDFYYSLKKEVFKYPFKQKRNILVNALTDYKFDLESGVFDGNILAWQGRQSAIEEINSDYLYHKILKRLFNGRSKNKDNLVKEIVYFKTASTIDLEEEELFSFFSSMIILNKEQLNMIKRCFYFKETPESTNKNVKLLREEIQVLEEKIKQVMYQENDTYSF